MKKSEQTKTILQEVRTLLETLIGSDDNATLGNVKPFLLEPLQHVKGLLTKAPPQPKAEPEFPEFKSFIEIWHQTYPNMLMMPRDGSKIKSLIDQTRKYVSTGGGEVNIENVCLFWEKFVLNLKKTWAHGRTLSTIESNYPSIIFEMKNGKKQSGYINQPSAKRIINGF